MSDQAAVGFAPEHLEEARRAVLQAGADHVRELGATARRRLPHILVPLLDLAAVAAVLAARQWLTPIGLAYGVLTWFVIGGVHRGVEELLPGVAHTAVRLWMRMAMVIPALAIPAAISEQAYELLFTATATIPAILLARAIAFGVVRRARRERISVQRAILVGTGEVSSNIANALLDHPEYGLAPVGFIGAEPDPSMRLPWLGRAADLRDVVLAHGVERIIVAFGHCPEAELVDALRACDDLGVDVLLVPRLYELGLPPVSEITDNIWGYPIVRFRLGRLRGWRLRAKRALDITGATAMIVLTAPIMAAIPLMVRLSSPGPILFRQKRVGKRGREFHVLKFRSLKVNEGSDSEWSVASDPRVTRVGSILRRTSLDELPQLFNVLRGDMSLVGPRPERPHFVVQFSQEVKGYVDRHRALPGITGWAQVHGLRGDTSISDRARFDNQYIEQWSLTVDLAILLRTFGSQMRDARAGPR